MDKVESSDCVRNAQQPAQPNASWRWLFAFGARAANGWMLALVIVAALILAAVQYGHFLDGSRERWADLYHDRIGHYAAGMKMAVALRQGDLSRFCKEVRHCTVWPPVHALLVSGTLTIGGIDYRLAVLPSLGGWVLLVVCAFLAARRMQSDALLGNIAGVATVIFIAASSAHRAYATDTMLESLGAGLSMLALYLYLVCRQQPLQVWAWRCLALALSVLFFEKYNYWMLVVLALVAASIAESPRSYIAALQWLRERDWRQIARQQFRYFNNWVFLAVFGVVTLIQIFQPEPLNLYGHVVRFYPAANLSTVAYVLFLLCVLRQFRLHRGMWSNWSSATKQLALWHVVPIAASLSIPKRLTPFLWYLSTNNADPHPAYAPLRSAALYWRTAIDDNHLSLWSLALVVALFFVALSAARRLRPGVSAIFALALIGAAAVVFHPNCQGRFLHTWLPAWWVAAGTGLTMLSTLPALDRQRWLGASFAAIATVALGIVSAGEMTSAGRSSAEGHRQLAVSLRDVTDIYLPHLAHAHKSALLASTYCEPLFESTFLERYPNFKAMETPIEPAASIEQLRQQFDGWIHTTDADTVVVVDMPPASFFHRPTSYIYEVHGRLDELMSQQTTFAHHETWTLPQYGCSVQLWRRSPSIAATPTDNAHASVQRH